jgi:hypothetical protein
MRARSLVLASVFIVGPGTIDPAQGADAAKPERRVLGADRGRIALVNARGEVEWEIPNRFTVHDMARLPNGNILFQSNPTTIVEVSPEKQVVWKHVSKPKDGSKGPVEVHAFQRLDDGLTMIAETGNLRIIEVDRDGVIVHEIPLTVNQANSHSDTRLARKLAGGHYLVCHESDGVVREYDPTGKVVWSYALDLAGRPRTPGHNGHGNQVYGALRLENGHTLIGTGNGNRVIEVSPEGKTVWSLEQDELPGIKLFWVTHLTLLPNGNLIVGNCHAGPENPQLIEITRDKKVVWSFKDHTTFGNDLATALVLDSK